MKSKLDVTYTTGLGGIGQWYNPLSWEIVTGVDLEAEQQRSRRLDAQLAEVNEEARTTGRIDEATYQKTVEHLAAQMAATENIQGEVNEAFVEGWIEGYENELAILESIPEYAGRIVGDVTAAVGRGAGKGLGSILGGIPWWLWLAGGVALFVYLGGGRAAEGLARKKISAWGEK